ncbi:MAG: MBL fold metallo-hydrolase [Alphaproteobacteria bacterium]|nr:MBL fold metallo-hydrolase [Alphaproteobacteria bacterium]
MNGILTILGCGNSTGVPSIGNYWGVCDPAEPKNRRSRCSALVESGQASVIIDTGPDFREQFNKTDKANIDAVLYSHPHGDHVNGIDDLRGLVLRRKGKMPVFGNAFTVKDLQARFPYMFEGGALAALYPPLLEPFIFDDFGKSYQVQTLHFIPFAQDHKTCQTVGYRFGDLAYSVDLLNLETDALHILHGIKTWVVDCAAYKSDEPSVHANLRTIMLLNETIGAKRVVLTSLSLGMDYQSLKKDLPPGYEPAYDGLQIPFTPF